MTAMKAASSASNIMGWDRKQMAARLAQDIPEGWYVNLGIGIPLLVGNYIPEGREVVLQSENGIVGMGPLQKPGELDTWIVNAGKQNVTLMKGAAMVSHSDSFAMIRGGHLDLCVLGSFEVAANGDFANWTTSLKSVPAVGGAMDLAVGAQRIWLIMEHTSKDGKPRLLETCAMPVRAYSALYIGGMGSRDKNFYNQLATRMGYEEAAIDIQNKYLAKDQMGAMAAVPLDFIDKTALIGPADRVRDRLHAYADAGVTTLTVATYAGSLEERLQTLRTMAEVVESAGLA